MKVIKSMSNTVSKSLAVVDNVVDSLAGLASIVKTAVDTAVLEQHIESLADIKAIAKENDISEEDIKKLQAELS